MTTLAEMDALTWKARGNVVVICHAGQEDCARVAKRYEITAPMIADTNNEIGQRFRITGVPMAILIDENNRIESYGQPLREQDLKEVVEDATEVGISAGR